MNEVIIVDSVNVAGCEFAVKTINDNRIKCHCAKGLLQIAKMQEQPESIKSGLCENNPDCYYKQLKRLEQERDELKKACEKCKLFDIEKTNRDLLERIEKLEQENKELKNKNICRETCKYFKRICNENTLLITYRSALEEIRNVLKEICKEECDYTKPKFCGDCDCRYGQILTKINECLQ